MPSNKNICECPTPPGGRAVCEADQLAICRIKDGDPETYCLDPPLSVRVAGMLGIDRDSYLNWALSEITGAHRSLGAEMNNADRMILAQGIYEDPETGDTIKFRIPDSVMKKTSTKTPPTTNQPPPGLALG